MKTQNKEYTKWWVLKVLHKNYPTHSFDIEGKRIIVDGKKTPVFFDIESAKIDMDSIKFLTHPITKFHLCSKIPTKPISLN